MDAFVVWLKATAISQAIGGAPWLWPFCETLHFVGLTLVIGVAGFFDLRLMGFMKRIPVSAAWDLMPFALGGFLLNLATGLVFFVGLPEQYVHNRVWWAKVCFLLLAGLNALIFQRVVGPRTVNVGAGEDTPVSAKIVGAASLVFWLGVLYCGRMLPFLGDAF